MSITARGAAGRAARLSGAAALACAILSAAAAGQSEPQRPVPVEKEPQHRHVFENAVLAVLDVRFPPGYTSLFHTHSNDNVSVRIETGPTRIDTLEAAGTPQTALVGRVVFNSASPAYTHRVANLGNTTIRILDIEILAKGPTGVSPAPDQLTGHELIVENDRVRIHRIVLSPNEALAAHTHPRGRLDATVRGSAPGTFTWHGPGTSSPPLGPLASAAEVVEIEVK